MTLIMSICIDFKKQDLISCTVATFYRSLPIGLHEVTATLNYTVYITLPTPLQLLTASQLNAVPSHCRLTRASKTFAEHTEGLCTWTQQNTISPGMSLRFL